MLQYKILRRTGKNDCYDHACVFQTENKDNANKVFDALIRAQRNLKTNIGWRYYLVLCWNSDILGLMYETLRKEQI